MSKAKNNRSPQRTPAKMKARVGELFADQRDRQRELCLGDHKTTTRAFSPRVATLLKGMREQLARRKGSI
jgi:hypothetical protein